MDGFYERLGKRLSLYVKQLAWLNTRRERKTKTGKDDVGTRLAELKAQGIEPSLPFNPLPYITDWLFEIGPTVPAGMGMARLGWPDLLAWQSISGIELSPWEATTLRGLSSDYLNMSLDAKVMECPAPYLDAAAIARNRQAISQQMKQRAAARMKGS